MKKSLILIGIFIITVVAGFVITMLLDQGEEKLPPVQSQVNYLLIRVDDLTKPKPVLQSAWGIFTSFTNTPSIYFQQIYPSTSSRTDLRAIFALNEKRAPVEAFTKEIDKFDLKLNGYLMVDDRGAQVILSWVTGNEKFQLATPSAAQQRSYFNQVCQGLANSTFAKRKFPDWKTLYPDHFIPSPKIEEIIVLFDQLFFKSAKVECHGPD